ncbi:filamentous hemagglutinin N-terminal domain-containing protein [Anabaena sp. FACHB-709]|uniref:S-layer family protein n=1 Tax=Anabaena cylindrica FACHB-318 TaxID=2692880 RepID=A0ABR7ZK32_ANACY|nr:MULTISPECIES: S-layer family protein [Nostocaceae]MBD2172673.1 S-layer family protein [Anabaena cylindrica FACHB-318]MBD2264357.1 S-layer family protein [Anabaena sp. FACHB-709]MBD2274129.1 S-layer family protein [Nostoc sp. PCC 7120 = FACHB-418]MBD2284615.1 S-layer family protein [Anabaena cylindrica FACHB-170]
MKFAFVGFVILSAICLSAVNNNGVYAQVTSDNTLGTVVDSNYSITNGIQVGNNLFHSFSQFSIPPGSSVSFDNATDIQNIFSRVTGGNISHIDGEISAKGNANLFLINPAGIIFGKNTSLSIGGSFVATTANTIKFADGTEFSATKLSQSPLLTMSVPIGLQLGQNSGKIALQGTGHHLTSQNPLITPYVPTVLETNLAVKSGRTLALVGSSIDLNGGILFAPQGRVELGGVTEGEVTLNRVSQGFNLDYQKTSTFGDIDFTERSLVNVNGINAGSIQVQGRTVSLTDGSVLWVQNRGIQKGGDIYVFASDTLKLSGATTDLKIRTSIINEAVSSGRSGNISVVTPNLSVNNGAVVANRNYKSADSGYINITTSNLNVNGYISTDPSVYAAIGTLTFSTGKAGDVIVATQNLSVLDGGYLGSTTFGLGTSGTVTIDAAHVNVIGATPISIPSIISNTTIGRGGNAGKLRLNTRTLTIKESGSVTTASLGVGNAGDLTVNATESINISGRSPSVPYGSNISSTVGSLTANYYTQLSNVSEIPRGSSGQVTVNTPILKISDEARINTGNYGIGNAGALNINTEMVELNKGFLASFTASGQGGDMNIHTNALILRDQSLIIGTALGSGDGGNIMINSPVIVGFNNSDIMANAVTGRGGNIQITTQGIFGLKFRPQLTPENDITASSQFGVNGTVQVNNVGVDPNSGLVELPANVTDPSQQIATGCSNANNSSFVATGRGGVPQNPTLEVRSDRTWSDIRDISAYRKINEVKDQIPTPPQTLVQATSWHRNTDGKIEIVADKSSAQVQQLLTCAAVSQS